MQGKSGNGREMPAKAEKMRCTPKRAAGEVHETDTACAAGDIVVSTAGRDAGLSFFVLEACGGHVMLADGRHRRAARPKRKSLKHIKRVARGDTAAECAPECDRAVRGILLSRRGGECPPDRALWRALRTYGEYGTAAAMKQTQAFREVD